MSNLIFLLNLYNCYYEKKGKEIKNITDEIPFEIPDSWVWIRLSSAYIPIGTGVPKYSGTKEYYSTGSVSCDGFIPEGCYSYENRPSRANRICFKNDLIDAKMQSTNKCIIIKENLDGMLFSTGFYCFRALINSIEYLQNFINSGYFQKAKDSLCTGVTQKAINDDKLFNILIPLPPLNEQHRINFQLLKIAALIQTYERQEKQLSYLESSFEEKLKASILQYAIEGRLVKQDPNDEPASVLLEHIKTEKEKLIKEGKIKRDKHDSEIVVGVDKNYYVSKALPESWVLLKAKQLTKKIQYGLSISSEQKYIDYKIERDDIFIARTGGTIGKSFRLVESKENVVFAGYLIRFQLIFNTFSEYISRYLNSPAYWKQVSDKSMGTGQPNINGVSLGNLVIPLPPVSEQKRINNKINKLFCIIKSY